MKLQPLADRIVAREIEAEAKSPSGILLPDNAKDKTQMGDVIAVGAEVKEVKVGDRIIHSEYGPNRIKLDGQELLLVKEEDVYAIVKKG